MVKLTPSRNLCVEDNYCDEDENQGVIYVATVFDTDTRPLKYDRSPYGEHVSLDDHFLIDVYCRCTYYNTDVLKEIFLANQGSNNNEDDDNNEDNDDEKDDDDDEFDDDNDDDDYYGPDTETSVLIDKSFQRPVQGFPTNYVQAWHVVYKWLVKELDTVPDFVLPLLTEELTHLALYLLDQITNRKKLKISLDGVIYEKLLFETVPIDISGGINWFITEVGVWEKVEPLDDQNGEFVINVYSEYRPIGSEEGSICKAHKCSHPAHELWCLSERCFTDIVSLMLKQVNLPGELPHLCLLQETITIAKLLFRNIPRKNLELNAVIRITEAFHPTPKYGGDVEFSRLSLPSDLLLKPLLSCHL